MEHEQNQSPPGAKPPVRPWTQRVSGPIRYSRFTGKDAGGRDCIFFRVEAPSGPSELSQQVFDIFRELKVLHRGPEHGGGTQSTGLVFNRDRVHGRVWKLPDNPLGRTAADIIDARLSALAQRLEDGPEPGLGR